MSATYTELKRLFHNDERLKRTVPTQTYELDEAKFAKWKREAGPDLVKRFGYLKISFDDWLRDFAKVFDQLLSLDNSDFIVSTGLIESQDEQSASELWINYIFKAFMSERGYTFEEKDEYWYLAKNSQSDGNVRHVLFLDDWVRTGVHMTSRIFSTPNMTSYLIDPDTKVIIAAPIIPLKEIFQSTFSDVAYDKLDPEGRRTPENTLIVEGVLKRMLLFGGSEIDVDKHPNILLDHNSGEKYDSELFYGFIGIEGFSSIFIGSLVKGVDPSSSFRYPPPLYHAEFGSGRLPKNSRKLDPIPGRPGYYTISY